MTRNKILILILLYIAFIALGLPDQLLGVAWPSMRKTFGQSFDAAGQIVFIMTICTALSGYLNGLIIKKYSISAILITSVFLTVIGMMGFALSKHWLILLSFALPLGIGAGSIDSSLNNYVSMNFSSKHMSWLHAFWGIGSTIGPVIMTAVFALGFNWRYGYGTVAFLLFLLTVLFFLSKNLLNETENTKENSAVNLKMKILNINTFLSSSFFFIYTATEGAIGVWIYSVMTAQRHFNPVTAGILVSAYWGALTVGRIFAGFVTEKLSDKRIIMIGLISSFIAMLILCFDNKITTAFSLVLAGFGLAGLYPCEMKETHKRYRKETALVLTGYEVGSASLGYGIIIPIIGAVIQRIGLNFLPVILLFFLMYLIIIELKLRNLNNF